MKQGLVQGCLDGRDLETQLESRVPNFLPKTYFLIYSLGSLADLAI